MSKEDEIYMLEQLLGASSNISNFLYNVTQNTEHFDAAQASIREYDGLKHQTRVYIRDLKESLIDADALQAWKDANMPTPRETWIAGYLAAKGGPVA